MKPSQLLSRRNILQGLSSGAALVAGGAMGCGRAQAAGQAKSQGVAQSSAKNSAVRVGAVGMGIMGFKNCDSLRSIAGVELAAVCDLYDGHLLRAQEKYGRSTVVTRDFEQLLNDESLDALVISTTDHWHQPMAIQALARGKAVYLEKPMVHRIDQGLPLIEAHKRSGVPCQIGSQRVSSVLYQKAAELYAAGEIGQLVMAEAAWDRQSALGAWQYSIPRDASPQTVDWDRFLGYAPKRAFDLEHFFHWRNYRAYGTGIAGDLFVHLFSGMHTITGSLGPNRVYASGGLRYWKDGRDVPDVMMGIYDYPESKQHAAFNLQLRVNFIDGGGGGGESLSLVGTEGKMTIGYRDLKVTRNQVAEAPGFGGWDTYDTFDKKNQQEFSRWYDKHYQNASSEKKTGELTFEAPAGYSDHRHHHENFIAAVRGQRTVVEDPEFGFRAAAVALASNQSVFERKPIDWDPVAMRQR